MQHLTQALFDELSRRAAELPRRRTHHTLHTGPGAPVQRMLVALQPGTYIRPHRHPQPHQWELLTVLRGAMSVLVLDDEGTVEARLELAAGGRQTGVELPPARYHTLIANAPDTVMLEVKEGPYRPEQAAEFAAWAPAEGEPAAPTFERWARGAAVGERWR